LARRRVVVTGLGIVAPVGGSGSALIHDLTIRNVTGDGISLASFARLEDNGDTTVSFNATINRVNFEDVAGNDIVLDAFTNEDLNLPTVNLDEVLNIANVTSTGNGSAGVVLSDTHVGGTFNLNQYNYTGAAGSTNGLLLTDIAGSVSSVNTTIRGSNGTGTAIEVQNGTGNINFQSTVLIDDYVGRGVFINGGDAGTITFAGDIDDHTGGRSIEVTGRSGGTVTFSSTNSVDDDGAGIRVANNTGGTINFQGTYDLDTTTNAAVTITNNTGATINMTGLDIDTTSGAGFIATGGGTLGVTGVANSITTTTGRGLEIQNMTIAAGGATFQNVNVDGAANGILINNTTGGQITIGNGVNDGDGGSLTTTGNAIEITNAANVDLNDIRVVNSGMGTALVATHTNATAFDLRVDNLDVDAAAMAMDINANGSGKFDLFVTGGTMAAAVDFEANGSGNIDFTFQNAQITTNNNDIAFRLELDSLADDANIRIVNNEITTGDANAFLLDASPSVASIVDFLFDQNTLSNDSATARTAQMQAANSTRLNATVTDNTFSSNGGAENLLIESVSANTRIDLNLNGNTAAGAPTTLRLLLTNGTFNVVDRDDANANNGNDVVFDPNIAAFGDITSVPTP